MRPSPLLLSLKQAAIFLGIWTAVVLALTAILRVFSRLTRPTLERLLKLYLSPLSSIFWGSVASFFVYRNLLNPDYQRRTRIDATEQITLPLRYHHAFDLCLASLQRLPRTQLIREDKASGRIDAFTTPTWHSYGEKLTLRLDHTKKSTTITITSRPPFPLGLIDPSHKHARNVQLISSFLQGDPNPPHA